MGLTATMPSGPIDLVCPMRGATIILTADELTHMANGGYRVARQGRKIKFRDHRATVDPEDFMLLTEHPAFTGQGEPRIVFTADDADFIPPGPGGPQVVDGAIASSTGRRMRPPLAGYDRMQYGAIRYALQAGKFESVVDALVYERANRSREGVIRLFAAALIDAERLPTVTTMRKADEVAEREAKIAAALAAPAPEPAPRPSFEELEQSPEVADALAAAEQAGIDIDPEPEGGPSDVEAEVADAIDAAMQEEIAPEAEAPIPEEGVL